MEIQYNAHRAKIRNGLTPEIEEKLVSTLSYTPAGSEYNPAANKFIWVNGKRQFNKQYRENFDPRVKLYNRRTGEFPTGLLRTVMTLAPHANLTAEFPIPTVKTSFQIKTLYPYQKQVINALIGFARGMAEVPTGGGKTFIVAELILRAKKDTNVIVTVPSVDLLHQTRDELARITKQPIGIYGDSEKQPERITVATVQSLTVGLGLEKKTKKLVYDEGDNDLQKRLHWINQTQMWIVDECHGASTDSYKILSQLMPRAMLRYGLTATLRREDNSELVFEGVLGPLRVKIKPLELVEAGFLTPPTIELHVYEHPTYRTSKQKPPYLQLYRQAIIEHEGRTAYIKQLVAEALAKGEGPVIVLFERIEHGEKLYEALSEVAPTMLVNGATSTKNRIKAKQGVTEGTVDIVVASVVWVTGVNIPKLRTLIVAGSGRSGIMTVQRAGRVLRTHPDKPNARIIDICDDEEAYLEDQYVDRRFYYNEKYPGCVTEVLVGNLSGLADGADP